jgi:hypothetical protein
MVDRFRSSFTNSLIGYYSEATTALVENDEMGRVVFLTQLRHLGY